MPDTASPPPSRFEAALGAGTLVTAELTPPRTADASRLLLTARTWSGAVDAALVDDCLFATARMSPIAVAALLRETGLEAVLQTTLRHRNRIAVQSDLLGAHALGVRGVVVLAGAALALGSDPRAREIRDLRSAEALELTRRLSEDGVLFDGRPLPTPLAFTVGAVESIDGGPNDAALRRVEAKIASGAQWLQVQGATEPEVALAWLDALRAEGVHERVGLVGSVVPVPSLERLDLLEQVPGVSLPAGTRARLSGADPEGEGLAQAAELGAALFAHPATSGVNIRPFGWCAAVPELADRIRCGVPAPPGVRTTWPAVLPSSGAACAVARPLAAARR